MGSVQITPDEFDINPLGKRSFKPSKQPSDRWNLKTPALRFSANRKRFETSGCNNPAKYKY